jgi:glycosyltransferase involved in cell wall biosynthesis
VFDKAIAKTDELAGWLKRHGIETAIVSQFPIALDYWKPSPRESRTVPIVGYVGRTDNKNIKQLVSMARSVGGCRVKLTVNDRIDNEGVRSLGCEVVTGQPLMKPAYQDMDVFMMTSLTEGVPRVIMEAMAMSLPVIVWGVGGIPTLNATHTFPPNSVENAKSVLRELVSSPEKRKEIGKLNHARIEEYDIEIRNKLSSWFERMA